jgi:uncharacterized protein YkwD
MAPPFVCALAAAAALSIAGCAQKPPPPPPAGEPTFYRSLASRDARIDAAGARDMISIYRRNHGLPALALDPALEAAAQARANAMARAGQVSQGPRTPKARLAGQGLERAHAAENVSAGYYTMAEAFSGWRDSRPHNVNMLDPRIRRMGIATAYAPGSKHKVFWALVLTE